MLKVNLLPPEKRKLKRTPYYALVPLVVSVALLTGSIAAAVLFYMEDQELQQQIAAAKVEVSQLEPFKARYEALDGEIKLIQGRIGSIEQITKRSVFWGEVLAALVEVTSKNPRVWLDDISYLDANRAQAKSRQYDPTGQGKPPYAIQLTCNIAPDAVEDPKKADKVKYQTNVAYMIKFRRDLKEHPKLRQIFPDFHPKIPEWQDKTDVSKEGIKMTFEVVLIAR
jgi:hypothetical protein